MWARHLTLLSLGGTDEEGDTTVLGQTCKEWFDQQGFDCLIVTKSSLGDAPNYKWFSSQNAMALFMLRTKSGQSL